MSVRGDGSNTIFHADRQDLGTSSALTYLRSQLRKMLAFFVVTSEAGPTVAPFGSTVNARTRIKTDDRHDEGVSTSHANELMRGCRFADIHHKTKQASKKRQGQ